MFSHYLKIESYKNYLCYTKCIRSEAYKLKLVKFCLELHDCLYCLYCCSFPVFHYTSGNIPTLFYLNYNVCTVF